MRRKFEGNGRRGCKLLETNGLETAAGRTSLISLEDCDKGQYPL